jgi:hypothetical protein
MHRTGLAAAGQDGGCPWIAVRHEEVSIHLVAMLAQEDGRPVRLWNDFLRLREGCLAAERRYGLTVTAPADRTAATHTTRGEREKAARAGRVRRLGTGCVARSGWLRSPPAATPSSWTGCGRSGWR